MEKVAATPTVLALTGNNIPELKRSVSNRVGDLLECPNIAMLKKVVDTPLLEMFLADVLTDLVDAVNIDQRLNIQGHQVPVIAAQLVDQYPTESLEDFVLCFRRGSTGFYGTIYNLDASVLNNWMRAYLEEKYSLIEAEHTKAKRQEADTLGKVDYKAFIERKEKEAQQAKENPKVPENWKTNELERFKLDYQKNSREQKQQRLFRASSEFYKDSKTPYTELKVFEDADGLQVIALNEQDAETIYSTLTVQP